MEPDLGEVVVDVDIDDAMQPALTSVAPPGLVGGSRAVVTTPSTTTTGVVTTPADPALAATGAAPPRFGSQRTGLPADIWQSPPYIDLTMDDEDKDDTTTMIRSRVQAFF